MPESSEVRMVGKTGPSATRPLLPVAFARTNSWLSHHQLLLQALIARLSYLGHSSRQSTAVQIGCLHLMGFLAFLSMPCYMTSVGTIDFTSALCWMGGTEVMMTEQPGNVSITA